MTGTSTFLELLPRFPSVRILCVGDIMLDHFVYGTVERISPEAPIPVLKVTRETEMLGGAGNVARNIAALGARATLISVVGDDAPGHTISRLIAQEPNIEASLVTVPPRQTSLKVRHIAANQQMLRIDRETTEPLAADDENRLCQAFEVELPSAAVVILSDYAKGVLTPNVIRRICALARKHGKPVIADPKNNDFRRYEGVNILTPNAKELATATGMPVSDDRTAELAAARAVTTAALDAILVTRSEQGMTLSPKSGPAVHYPTQAREVFDVSGAGDTVIATLAVALASGAPLANAAALANIAAGIVVGKAGTAVVRPDELAQALQAEDLRGVGTKIRALQAAIDTVTTWRSRGLKVGFTNGCFDLVHPGHISLLAQARNQCDRLIVGLNTDNSVKRLKGPTRPINAEMARAVVLAALESVDMVILFDEETPVDLIKAVRPDVLVKGADYTIDKVVGGDFVMSYGGKVHLADLTPGQSTTSIVQRMATPIGKAGQ
jgi:D-beta-D-heptose 7-phosphate kinase/D-beta-D-heptose 1-phosphate adenosyltransferase